MSPIYRSPQANPTASDNIVIVLGHQAELMDCLQTIKTEQGYLLLQTDSIQGAQSFCIKNDSDRQVIIIQDSTLDDPEFLHLIQSVSALPKQCTFILSTQHYRPDMANKAIDLGVFFFLTQPYSQEFVATTVSSALQTELSMASKLTKLDQSKQLPALVEQASFSLKTPAEAKSIAAILGFISPAPNKVSLGLFELMLNSIEHGNLAIGYDQKTDLLESGRLKTEVEERLKQPEYVDKSVRIQAQKTDRQLIFTIKDEGKGFDFNKYLERHEHVTLEKHGRGILIANQHSFDELHYEDGGTTAVCAINLP